MTATTETKFCCESWLILYKQYVSLCSDMLDLMKNTKNDEVRKELDTHYSAACCVRDESQNLATGAYDKYLDRPEHMAFIYYQFVRSVCLGEEIYRNALKKSNESVAK